jgi:hypothetical protein
MRVTEFMGNNDLLCRISHGFDDCKSGELRSVDGGERKCPLVEFAFQPERQTTSHFNTQYIKKA